MVDLAATAILKNSFSVFIRAIGTSGSYRAIFLLRYVNSLVGICLTYPHPSSTKNYYHLCFKCCAIPRIRMPLLRAQIACVAFLFLELILGWMWLIDGEFGNKQENLSHSGCFGEIDDMYLWKHPLGV